MTTAPGGGDTPEWVTLREASEVTGKTVKTMRRWATTGKVAGQKDPTGQWFVRKGDLIDVAPTAKARAELDVLSAELVATREMFHRLAEDLATARERAGRAEADAEGERDRRERTETERDQLRAEVAELAARRWWQRRPRS